MHVMLRGLPFLYLLVPALLKTNVKANQCYKSYETYQIRQQPHTVDLYQTVKAWITLQILQDFVKCPEKKMTLQNVDLQWLKYKRKRNWWKMNYEVDLFGSHRLLLKGEKNKQEWLKGII